MPELPEVQTIVDGIQTQALNRTVTAMTVFPHRMLKTEVPSLTPFRLIAVERFGKYILLTVDSGWRIVLHLGMSGKVMVDVTPDEIRHLRMRFDFADGGCFLLVDPRGFGRIAFRAPGEDIPEKRGTGIEPLSPQFTGVRLHTMLHGRRVSIKPLLLEQRLIAGIGNIYASEALFRAGIHPAIPGTELTMPQCRRLVTAIRHVLSEAIAHNGTTISDFRRVDEKTGDFQAFLRIYEKKTCACGAVIERITQSGRTTWFCPKCQKRHVH